MIIWVVRAKWNVYVMTGNGLVLQQSAARGAPAFSPGLFSPGLF